MAITKQGNEWLSSLTGFAYSSREAAEHYENRAKLEMKKPSKGQKLIDAMSTADLKEACLYLHNQIEENNSRPVGNETAIAFFQQHPEIITDGMQGTMNGTAIDTFLRNEGFNFPYTPENYNFAYDRLMELGVLHLNPAVKVQAKAYEAAPPSFLDLMAANQRRY